MHLSRQYKISCIIFFPVNLLRKGIYLVLMREMTSSRNSEKRFAFINQIEIEVKRVICYQLDQSKNIRK